MTSPSRVTIGSILLASVVFKGALILCLADRVYPDASRALSFGYLAQQGMVSIDTHFINNKTFLGPVLWFALVQAFGMVGLKAFNLLLFVLLFFVQCLLGKGRYDSSTIALALCLFAFYVGTNLNIVAGETDDIVAAFLFGLGVLIYVRSQRPLASSLLMGAGFLFKFSTAIFVAGFALYLLTRHRLRDLWLAGLGVVAPFALINWLDGFQSLRALFFGVAVQRGFSSWQNVGFKVLSTGMLVSVVMAAWAWLKNRNDHNTLFFMVSSSYVVYVLVNRDAFSASFVMMQSLLFSSFLIAECMLTLPLPDGWNGHVRRRGIIAVGAAYIALTSAVTCLRVYRETKPVALVDDRDRAERMFGLDGRR